MGVFYFFLALSMVTLCYSRTFDVMDYGAVGDGETDDSRAFAKAWKAACAAGSNCTTLNLPKDKTFLLPHALKFQGPCKSNFVQFQLEGSIVAPKKVKDWKDPGEKVWLKFQELNGLIIDGNGQIDGKGDDWWEKFPNVPPRPTAVMFRDCSNIKVNRLHSKNTPRDHISISGVVNATLSHITLTAPDDSPHTDGIDISRSKNINITDSVIATGDDCIAITSETSNVYIDGLSCGPGHGISIGSLGKYGNQAAVENIHVENCILNSTQNGARIKTWQGGRGYARNITFKDIQLVNTHNPIFIDQFYCPHATCAKKASAVEISDVTFSGIYGTTSTENAIALNCSDTVGCKGIILDQINITSSFKKIVPYAHCNNAHGQATDVIPKVNCLLS